MTHADDALKRLYEEAGALDERRPASHVRAAVLAHAQMVLDAKTEPQTAVLVAKTPGAANLPSWKAALVASVLLVPLVGILVSRNPEQLPGGEQVSVVAQSQPQSQSAVAEPPAAAVLQPAQANAEAARANGAVPEKRARPEGSVARADRAKPVAPPNVADAAMAAQEASVGAQTGPVVAAPAPAPVAAGAVGAVAGSSVLASNAAQRSAKSATMADAVQADATDQTALFFQAVAAGRISDVEGFVVRGASVNARNAAGKTVLIVAVQAAQEATVARLLALGANPGLVDRDGLTALQHAQRLGHARIVVLLARQDY